MKNSFARRALAVLLTLALCLTLAPAIFAAEESDGYKIAITGGPTEVRVGETINLTAEVTKDGAQVTPVICTWGRSDPLKATVDPNSGAVTGVAEGDVTITASYTLPAGSANAGETISASRTIKVTPSPGETLVGLTGVLNATELNIKTGSTETLSFIVKKEMGDGNKDIDVSDSVSCFWESKNTSIVAVPQNGNPGRRNHATVSAVNPGSTEIEVTATYTQNGIQKEAKATCVVTVVRRMGNVRITPTGPFKMEPNGQQALTATTDPDGETVTWKSEDSTVASVQAANSTGLSAIIYANAPGRTDITASIGTEDNRETQTVKVEVSGMILDHNTLSLTENETQPLPGVTRYGSANNGRNITWQSTDIDVAEVSGSSVVGRGPGSATITGYAGAYSVSFTVNVTSGENTIEWGDLSGGKNLRFDDSSLISRFRQQGSQGGGTLSHLTSLSVPTNQGTLYYNYVSDAQHGEGVAQSGSYYDQSGGGRKVLSNITFVPKPNYVGPVVITYNAVSTTGGIYPCRILASVEQGSDPVFSLSTDYNTAVAFSGADFNRVCREQLSAQLDYVTFSLPPVRQGSLYTDYVSSGNFGSAVTMRDRFTQRDLDDVWFVPAPGFPASSSSESVTVYYTAHGKGGGSYSGQIRIIVEPEDHVAIGGLAYDVVKGGVARFDDVDFNDYCHDVLDSRQTLSFINFDSLPSADVGVLYYDYRSASNPGSRVSAGTSYYYGTRTPRIDRLVFVPAENYTGTIRLPFTGQTTDSTRFTGNVEINVRGSSTGSGDIVLTCRPGKSVSFDDSRFNRLCRDLTNSPLNYIEFQGLPNSSDGTVYYSGSQAAVDRRYYNGTSYPRIDNLSFRASNRFSGAVDIPFVGTATSGETFYGVVTIDSDNSGSSSGSSDIHYYTDSKTAAVFKRADFDDMSRWETDRDINWVRFSVPNRSDGDLYRGYYSSSSRGSRITSDSTTIYASDLNRVAFIPASGFTGTAYIDFTARATNTDEFSGTVEITVEQPSADVTVRYSTRISPITFRGGDFARSGYTLRSIQFGSMPSSSAGHLYYRYTSPTRYDRQASTGSTYNLTGSSQISELTFVPKAGYSGTVTLPYTGTNSNGSTFAGEVIITVTPAYNSAYFNDMDRYSDQQRGAVDYLYENGVTTGVGGGRYGPTSSITRGDFALMVYKAFGLSAASSSNYFNDVPSSAYYAQAVNALYSLGIVSGVGNGRFGPNNRVTREDAIIMVRQAMRAVGWSASDGYTSTLSGYSDGSTVSEYAKGAVAFALQMDYLPTVSGRVAPREQLTRVDMAQILHRVLTT